MFRRLLGVGRGGAVKVPQQFLLFRADADDRLARVLKLMPQPGDVLELRISIGMVSHRFLFRAVQRPTLSCRNTRRLAGVFMSINRRCNSRSDRFVHNTPTRIGPPAVNS